MVGFGLGKRAGRGALRLLKRSARVGGCHSGKRGMRPDVVVVVAPEGQRPAGIRQAVEDFFVQAFVAQTAVEAFDEGVPLGPAVVNVMAFDALSFARSPSASRRVASDRPGRAAPAAWMPKPVGPTHNDRLHCRPNSG